MPAANPYKSYSMDHDKEKDGVVVIENANFRVTGRRAGGKNVKFEQTRDFLTKPHRRAIATDTLDKATQDRLNAELAAKALVAKWEVNIANEGEEPKWQEGINDPETFEVVPVTEDLIVRTFIKYDELYSQFSAGCADIQNFLDADQISDDVGN